MKGLAPTCRDSQVRKKLTDGRCMYVSVHGGGYCLCAGVGLGKWRSGPRKRDGALSGVSVEGPLVGAIFEVGERWPFPVRDPFEPVLPQRGRCHHRDRLRLDALLSLPSERRAAVVASAALQASLTMWRGRALPWVTVASLFVAASACEVLRATDGTLATSVVSAARWGWWW